MKKIFMWLALAGFLASSAACDGERVISTKEGDRTVECEGFFTDLNPHYHYKLDTANAIWTFFGSCGTFGVIALAWALEYAYCPVGEALPAQ